jgi:hypothetical protein
MKIKILLTSLFFIIASCGGFKDAGKLLRNEKVKSTDEFLVKKKEPLISPPGASEIPEPGSIMNESTKNQNEKEIKKIFKIKDEDKKISNNSASSIEKSILNKIGK